MPTSPSVRRLKVAGSGTAAAPLLAVSETLSSTVPTLPGVLLEKLRKAGLQLIDQEPRTGIRGSRVAFMHPRATAGVLTEIVQPAAGLGGH